MKKLRSGLAAGLLPAAAFALILGCSKPPEIYAPPEYVNWRRTTDAVLNYPIPGHMDHFRIPRMNDIGFGAKPKLVGGKRSWDFPEDTVIVKEVYASAKIAPGDKPVQLTIMVKDPKEEGAMGGWLWYTKDMPDGKETRFAGNFCITCHANANERHPYGDRNPDEEFRDYVFFVPGEAPARASGAAGAKGAGAGHL